MTFAEKLTAIGIHDSTIAEAIRLGGDKIPVFSGQLRGCYVGKHGLREAHFAVPGWYEIHSVSQLFGVVLLNKHGERFETSPDDILFVLAPNLEYVAQGLKP